MLIVIDNYDSFTYNLVQYLGELLPEFPHLQNILVYRNDAVTIEQIKELQPLGIIISPGPGHPTESGISLDVIQQLRGQVPILGVCLGHQAIGLMHGGQITSAPTLMHGKTSQIFHNDRGVLQGLPNPFIATRYHSLVIDRSTLPVELELTAWTEDGTIMAVRHRYYRHLEGVQFHPESILTTAGKQILRNFLRATKPEG
ncbi:MAG: aminodeoxychorismate/anthranilate synthase component II [Pseudanabaenaceae cyanobacterium SKYGB_i_bin29]|nr:aminodeoxychorismate/anthranilate synthase component II [Pseudanabaenaceae cyanobacterium SKYG29]MDW8421603.1 aminodeoxychorismate/anthranilate synthase component II [Pseudanabaenaceae cyanobacterium SKYGB_i_bin29]